MSKISKLILVSLALFCVAAFSNDRKAQKIINIRDNGHDVKLINDSKLEALRGQLESVAANFEEICIAIEKNNKNITSTSKDQKRIKVNGISLPASAKVIHAKSGKKIVIQEEKGKKIVISQGGKKIAVLKGSKEVVTKLKEGHGLKINISK
jgi:hypothetical protein